ncbi:MAG TPA: M20/M25/M40 family metallo-hydrolase, partial [Patescibacteria group bacterium]|nr:M20/M25/M40 family metallo-hydrolase [Patescibacteria group bacterium]
MLTELEKAVFQYIEEHREGMIDYLRRLVSVDTQTPPGLNYDRICDIMADRFSGLGCETSVHEAPQKYLDLSGADFLGLEGPRSNVVAVRRGNGGGPTLHISAHIDCAAIQEEGWSVDPLGGEITGESPHGRSLYDVGGGYIWGRGVADDKGECAAMTLALEAIHELGVRLEGDLILTGNCDEEIGGVAGLGFLIKEGIVKADMGIQLDGGLGGINL